MNVWFVSSKMEPKHNNDKYSLYFQLIGLHNSDRGQAAGRIKYGSGGVCSGWRSEKIHQCQGIHQLSLLQWGNCHKRMKNIRNYPSSNSFSGNLFIQFVPVFSSCLLWLLLQCTHTLTFIVYSTKFKVKLYLNKFSLGIFCSGYFSPVVHIFSYFTHTLTFR